MRGSVYKLAGEFVNGFLNNKVGRALNPYPHSSGGMTNPLNLFNKDQLNKLAHMSGADISSTMGSYFRGRQFGGMGEAAGDIGRASIRRNAAMIGGSLVAANMLDIDPFGAVGAVGGLGKVAAHGLAGLSIRHMSFRHAKLAGNAYLALTALNAFRGGDQAGPL